MIFRNKYLFIIFSIVCLAGLIQQFIRYYNKEDTYESPKELSGKRETIIVNYNSRSCKCPMWIETKNTEIDTRAANQFFYLEPGTPDLPTPEALANSLDSNVVLKLEGEFYHGKGIPDNYKNDDSEREKANIFHYTAFEIVKPEATR